MASPPSALGVARKDADATQVGLAAEAARNTRAGQSVNISERKNLDCGLGGVLSKLTGWLVPIHTVRLVWRSARWKIAEEQAELEAL